MVIERFFTFSLIEMARLPTVLNIGHLQRMIRKARDMKMALEGEGHEYQHGKPRCLVIGASRGRRRIRRWWVRGLVILQILWDEI